MDKQARLAGARQVLEGAKVLWAHADFRGCVSRCYSAVYQALWAAVGEPEKKPWWEHLGIIQTFVCGRWFDPRAAFRGPEVFESRCFALHRLQKPGSDSNGTSLREKPCEIEGLECQPLHSASLKCLISWSFLTRAFMGTKTLCARISLCFSEKLLKEVPFGSDSH